MKTTGTRSLLRIALAPVAWPAVLLYAMGVRLKDAAYQMRLATPRQLSWPVISIGNLSVGGTGKTPLTLLLARLLETRGWSVDVLSRGYRRQNDQIARVRAQEDWRKFGDEPFLLARHGLAVYVGANRFLAGLLAEADGARDEHKRSIHILDDGFQHRQLTRSVEIVLLRRGDLHDEMLPLGRLRDPLAALERADICVLRAEEADLASRVLDLMRQTDPARIWIVERRTIIFAGSELAAPANSALAFCAIGDPVSFFSGLRDAAVDVKTEIAFRDHHVYTLADVERLKSTARKSGAKYLITTEKDAIRISEPLRLEITREFPLLIAGLELSLQDESKCMATLESLLHRPQAGSRRQSR